MNLDNLEMEFGQAAQKYMSKVVNKNSYFFQDRT